MPSQKNNNIYLNKLGTKAKSSKGRLLAVALLFAVIGGVFVYRSFAGTFYAWPYGEGFYPYGTQSSAPVTGCGTAKGEDKDPAGTKVPVLSMLCSAPGDGNAFTRVLSSGAGISDNTKDINGKGHRYRACVDARGSGLVSVGLTFRGSDIVSTPERPTTLRTFTYGNLFCSPSVYIANYGDVTAWVQIRKTPSATNPAQFVNVRNVQLQRVN